jgi:predicted HNH restriction endonuclease
MSTRPITKRLRSAGIIKKVSKREEWSKTIPHYYLKMKIWTAKVIEIDGMVCKDCGCENTFVNRLQAHHITPVRDLKTPELLFDISNGITLCMKCHYKLHYHEKEHEIRFRNLIQTRSSV